MQAQRHSGHLELAANPYDRLAWRRAAGLMVTVLVSMSVLAASIVVFFSSVQ